MRQNEVAMDWVNYVFVHLYLSGFLPSIAF